MAFQSSDNLLRLSFGRLKGRKTWDLAAPWRQPGETGKKAFSGSSGGGTAGLACELA